jgi:hypothetical protein
LQERSPATVAASLCMKVLQVIQVNPQPSARLLEFLAGQYRWNQSSRR